MPRSSRTWSTSPAPARDANPAVLALNEKAINKDDVVTANADNLFMAFAGAFSGTPADGLDRRPCSFKTSKDSELVDADDGANVAARQIAKSFKPSGTEYPLAIRLTGKFKTAFPDGKPKPPEAEPNEKKEEHPRPRPC